jgi:predicted nucleic acid-binding protein
MDLFREVAFLFDQIHIPRRVRQEFAKKFHSRKILSRLPKQLTQFRYCNIADEISVKLLLLERAGHRRKPRSDEGEAEAIVQAKQLGLSIVVMDDKKGREWALARGLECRGTMWILEELRKLEFIADLRPKIEVLARNNIRLPTRDVARLLARFNET